MFYLSAFVTQSYDHTFSFKGIIFYVLVSDQNSMSTYCCIVPKQMNFRPLAEYVAAPALLSGQM